MAKKTPQQKVKNPGLIQSTPIIESPFIKFSKANFIWISIGLSVFFSLLIFDIKPSIGGDDSSYVYRANEFVKNFTYPGGYQGPLYPIVLSVFIAVFGLNLILLKFLSLLFLSGSIYFFYKAFENEISPPVLLITCFVYSLNTTILYYSSQTYSEAFFMLLQSVAVWLLIKKTKTELPNISFISTLKNIALISVLSLFIYLTRSAGLFLIAGIAFYFLITKQYKTLVSSTFLTGLFLIAFKLFEKLFLGVATGSQMSAFLLKNSYKPDLGDESLIGFFTRFIENIYSYLGRILYEITFNMRENSGTTSSLLFLTSLLLLIIGIYWSFKKKSKVLFASIYSVVFLISLSTLLQQYWLNSRLMITIYPFIILVIFYGLEQTYRNLLASWRIGFVIVSVILVASVAITSMNKMSEQYKILKHNLAGDKFYGYTPDWENFLKVCEWSGNNLPDTVKIANRKETIYYLYSGGRKGFNIAQASLTNADSILATMKRNGITHLIYDNFTWSGTVRKFIQPVAEKYPEKLKVIHKEGSDNFYPSYLLEIIY